MTRLSNGVSPLRQLGLGRAWYWLYHYPLQCIAKSRREGGPLNQWINAQGHRAMRRAARRLQPVTSPGGDAVEAHFLTGRRFWHQTAFCFWSLSRHAPGHLRAVFLDDGTIDAEIAAEAKRLFPGSRVVRSEELNTRLDQTLSRAIAPSLRSQRETYLHLRKLTDVHAGRRGWTLVLDSDMLFFRRPDALLDWLRAPTRPAHMVDIQNAYGYPEETLASLAPGPLPQRLNVGVFGMNSSAIDWDKLEWWCAQLLQQHGTSYYLEQALSALLVSGTETYALPHEDYIVLPAETECMAPTGVLHHYVAESKRGYFRHAWKQAQR